ncbi:tRNA glutamyl-Q(34) synthetase GluQRS [Pontibacter sp. JAM-7]|uniref:tRNA glutamyl-Q(34) synthetase GluQRS n=1 Tax=Pontibacter sp. JAM-7 TaxID=3366581 RepID=UPI003AF5D83B
MAAANYIGRFAPSPTGALHFGSLLAALASYLDARAHNGQWLLRIEDLDPAREQPGIKADFARVLDAFGFEWDGPISYQSDRLTLYTSALHQLHEQHRTYPCSCSRKEIQQRTGTHQYDGHCFNQLPKANRKLATRLHCTSGALCFHDRIQGTRCHDLQQESGDFILRRRDGLIAYQLAVVVDDYLQGITHVVRGCDLLNETPRQIQLQNYLDYPSPCYAHIPVATNPMGQKLSKQTGATALDITQPSQQLFRALQQLHQSPPEELQRADVNTLISWAIQNWQCHNIPATEKKTAPLPE